MTNTITLFSAQIFASGSYSVIVNVLGVILLELLMIVFIEKCLLEAHGSTLANEEKQAFKLILIPLVFEAGILVILHSLQILIF